MKDLEKTASEYFFLVSKIEYALKTSDFFIVYDGGNVKPDWDKFIDKIGNTITLPIQDENIRFLAQNPPKKTNIEMR